MRLEKLRKLRKLYATPKMMQMAKADNPKIMEGKWGDREYKYSIYKYSMYMRCQQIEGYLKVAIFLTEHMRLGAKEPAYELFINPEAGEFITWDCLNSKWRQAKLDMIEWPEYVYARDSIRWINPGGNYSIKNLLKVQKSGFYGLLDYQINVRAEELKRAHRRETDPWDSDMELVPELPKDWDRWVSKIGIPEDFIFYRYDRKGATEGYCSYCEKIVPIRNPRNNKQGKCRCCGHEITYKAIGKAGCFETKDYIGYLLQKTATGFVIREFCLRKLYKRTELEGETDYTNPYYSANEYRRAIIDEDLNSTCYYYGLYKNVTNRWIQTGSCRSYGSMTDGIVYRRTLASLKDHLKYTGLLEFIEKENRADPERYLAEYTIKPEIELLSKAGLTRLARQTLEYPGVKIGNSGSLAKRLGIDEIRLKRLRENNGGEQYLEWMQYEKVINKPIPDELISWFSNMDIRVKDITFILDRMSLTKIKNYLVKESKNYQYRSCCRSYAENDESTKMNSMLNDWEDYLKMAKRVGMDVMDPIVYKPRNLQQRHDELTDYINANELDVTVGEYERDYPEVNKICKLVKAKYEWGNDKFKIIAPDSVKDIVIEGRALHHCVASDDKYYDRMNNRETYILFLRRTEKPDEAFYTIEIEPDGTVRQKRTMYNRQIDRDDVENFLRKWQKAISKNVTDEDMELAIESRRLRDIEYNKIKEDGKTDKKAAWIYEQLMGDVMEIEALEVSPIAI